jgi:hypothetical protein
LAIAVGRAIWSTYAEVNVISLAGLRDVKDKYGNYYAETVVFAEYNRETGEKYNFDNLRNQPSSDNKLMFCTASFYQISIELWHSLGNKGCMSSFVGGVAPTDEQKAMIAAAAQPSSGTPTSAPATNTPPSTNTAGPTNTPTPTDTPGPTNTPIPATDTPAPTNTVAPTATPVPLTVEQLVAKSYRDNLGFISSASDRGLTVAWNPSNGTLRIDVLQQSVFGGSAEGNAIEQASASGIVASKAIWTTYPAVETLIVALNAEFTDSTGNSGVLTAAATTVLRSTGLKFNYDGLRQRHLSDNKLFLCGADHYQILPTVYAALGARGCLLNWGTVK